MARSLRLNEIWSRRSRSRMTWDTHPFGHAGRDALMPASGDAGGFEHNLQSLRVVDQLGERYPTFDGLNLSFEAREGVFRPLAAQRAAPGSRRAGSCRRAGRRRAALPLNRTQPSLEAQLCNLADEVAYNAHDIDDGIRSG